MLEHWIDLNLRAFDILVYIGVKPGVAVQAQEAVVTAAALISLYIIVHLVRFAYHRAFKPKSKPRSDKPATQSSAFSLNQLTGFASREKYLHAKLAAKDVEIQELLIEIGRSLNCTAPANAVQAAAYMRYCGEFFSTGIAAVAAADSSAGQAWGKLDKPYIEYFWHIVLDCVNAAHERERASFIRNTQRDAISTARAHIEVLRTALHRLMVQLGNKPKAVAATQKSPALP